LFQYTARNNPISRQSYALITKELSDSILERMGRWFVLTNFETYHVFILLYKE
jgi:hypothetical protein